RRPQQTEPLLAEPLEAVRAAARLERPAAQDFRAGTLHRGRAGLDLLLALGGARTGHDDHLVAADADVADRDHRVVLLEGPAGELVGFGDPVDLLDPVQD